MAAITLITGKPSFNTQPPEGGWFGIDGVEDDAHEFQHTAARRRLDVWLLLKHCTGSFNTQPPEGGWARGQFPGFQICCFNTQPPEGGWIGTWKGKTEIGGFNTQPPEGGWKG